MGILLVQMILLIQEHYKLSYDNRRKFRSQTTDTLVLRLPRENASLQILFTWCFCAFWLRNVLRAATACTFSTAQLPKMLRTRQFLTLLTSKCASRHNGVHFFDISTSKSAPTLVCFVHFDLETRFAPQRLALFRHLNFQKWSVHGVFCRHVLHRC